MRRASHDLFHGRLQRRLPVVIAISAGFVSAQAASAQRGPQDVRAELEKIAVIEQKIMVPMRDGVRLATDVYRPKTGEPVAIVFSRTPYNFNSWRDGEVNTRTYASALEAVKRGYAYVVQNERGRFFSEGEWDILGTPTTDGWDAIEWMSTRPWSNGKVGLYGCSSTAEWQMAVAALDHPALAALVPMGFGAGVGRVGEFYEQGNWYRGGAQQMLFTAWLYGVQNSQRPQLPPDLSQEELVRLSRYFDLAPEMPEVDWSQALRHLPVMDIMKSVEGPKGVYEKMIRRKPNDPAWYRGGLYHDDMPFGPPSLWFMSWYDVSTGPNLAVFNHVRENAAEAEVRNNQFAVIAPTLHCAFTRATEETIVGERDMGDARLDYDEMIYGWFDTWLRGKGDGFLESLPKVRYYTMGSNQWQASESWPPAGARSVTYYLHSESGANSIFGDGSLSTQPPGGQESPDAFAYDPAFLVDCT